MPSRRQRQVADLIQEEIGILIQRELSDPRLEMVSVVAVDVSPDLRLAKIYVSHMGEVDDDKKVLAGLNHARGFLRHELGERIQLRFVPDLNFYVDRSVRAGQRIDTLLEAIHQQAASQPLPEQNQPIQAGSGDPLQTTDTTRTV